MFVVLITYTASIERITEVFQPHQAWMARQYAAGTFLMSGAQSRAPAQ